MIDVIGGQRPDPPSKPDERRALAALLPGRGRIRSSYDLARSLGIPQRSVGFLMNDLRQAGHLIGSVHGEGYYLIETPGELADTIEHIERRKRGIDKTINALRSSWMAQNGRGQLNLLGEP